MEFDPNAHDIELLQEQGNDLMVEAQQAQLAGNFGLARILTQQALAIEKQVAQRRAIQQGRQANILDPIHDTLAPTVWDNAGSPRPHLKDNHRKWIMREILGHAAKFEPNPERWLRLVLTGSLTTYQYSDTSDVDTSLFVDANQLGDWDRAKLIGLMVDNLDGVKLPGTPYQMQCFVVPKNITPKDLYQPGLRSGYDLFSQQWIVPPDPSRSHDVEREQNSDYIYALESADKMERLLRYEPQKAVQYWHQIHNRRRRDQMAGKGDYSQANIVYKFLANRGLFPQISEVSGEYIAGRMAAMEPVKVIYNKFRPGTDHPPGPQGPELPFIYAPEHNITFLGPPNSFHWDLITKTPELRPAYGESWTGAPFQQNSDHIHGRMLWNPKEAIFYGQQHDPAVKQAIMDGLKVTERQVPSVEELKWNDADWNSGRPAEY